MRLNSFGSAFVAALALGSVFTPASLAAEDADLPLVRIVATGGTIANSADGRMAIDTVLAQIPDITQHARIEVTDYSRIGSSEITVQNWVDISRLVNEIFATEPEVDAIVVTHGSNTSEETAYFLSLTVNHAKAVVVTAAQRPQFTLGAEGTRNLYDAIRVAADPDAAGKGVLLVVNELIHPAREVTKHIPARVEAWESGDMGALGIIDEERAVFYYQPTYRHTTGSEVHLPQNLTEESQMPRVDIIYTYAGTDGALAEAAVAAGAQALIIAGFPTGTPTPPMAETLRALRDAGTHVIMSNRGLLGRITYPTGNDFVSANNLTPQKARILAMLALARDPSGASLIRIFDEH